MDAELLPFDEIMREQEERQENIKLLLDKQSNALARVADPATVDCFCFNDQIQHEEKMDMSLQFRAVVASQEFIYGKMEEIAKRLTALETKLQDKNNIED